MKINKKKIIIVSIILLIGVATFIGIYVVKPSNVGKLKGIVVEADDPALNECFVESYNTQFKTTYTEITEVPLENWAGLNSLVCYNMGVKNTGLLKALTGLSWLDLSGNNITSIDLSANANLNTLFLANNSISVINLQKNTGLSYLDLSNNNISSIDLSQNKYLGKLYIDENQLKSLDLFYNKGIFELSFNRGNSFKFNNIGLLKGKSVRYTPSVIFPNTEGFNVTFSSENSNIGYIDNTTYYAYGKSVGVVDITQNMTYGNIYGGETTDTLTGTMTVVDVTSDSYEIDKETYYMYTGVDTSSDTILANTKIEGNGTLTISDNNLNVLVNNKNIAKFKLVNYASDTYKLSKDYVYTGSSMFDKTKVTATNATISENNNQMVITYGEKTKNIPIVTLLLKDYIVKEKNIIVGTKIFDINNVSVTNGVKEYKDGKLYIKYGNEVVDTYNVVYYTSSVYDLNKNYIYTGINAFDKTKVACTNCTLEVSNNVLNIKVGTEIINTYKLASISSTTYDLTKDDINVESPLDKSKITCINCELEIKDSKLNVKVGSDIVKTYNIIQKPTGIKGDVNGDGKVTVLDVAMLYRHVKKTQIITDEDILTLNDINGDGQITVIDVSLIYRYVKGKTNEL